MKKIHLIPLFFSLFFTVGCTDQILTEENKSLKEKNAKLQVALNGNYAQVEYGNAQASFAAGCDWLIPTCPSIAVASGRRFLAGGYGGLGWPMWAILILKLGALSALAGVSLASGFWMWARTGRPAAAATERAKALIADAENRLKIAEKRAAEALQRQRNAEWLETAAINRQTEAERAAEKAIAEAAEADLRRKDAESVRAALNSFDL